MSGSGQSAGLACDIAVIGMAGFFPDAPALGAYWRNIINGRVSIDEVPAERWDWRYYYDTDLRKPDKIASKWGAFLPDISFDPFYFGIPPKALPFIETSQLLLLESTRLAMADAGYLDRPFDRQRTSVFIGTGAGEGDLGQHYSFRSMLPKFLGDSSAELLENLNGAVPEWQEDVFTGIIMNIAAGRIADRFNLGGANCTIDAACASALAALRAGILELKTGESDLVIAGGADTLMSPYAYTCFSKVGALSGSGRSVPFDANADGIVLGEGVATVILKRLADAEKDGDNIYAVIKGVGASSDGRGKGLTVPMPEGQMAAIFRAYENAGVDPASIGLIEAHGTSTRAGDKSEATALQAFFSQTDMPARSCAVGSVKSMIGHTKCAAGIASLVKTVLALHYKILPPTAGVETPLPDLDGKDSPLYLNTSARPWISTCDCPRRAGVSAFGFGGTNFHAVLEEYTGSEKAVPWGSPLRDWDSELLVFKGDSTESVTVRLRSVVDVITESVAFSLKDLAYTLAVCEPAEGNVRLAIVASSLNDARAKMETALTILGGREEEYSDAAGIYFSRLPAAETAGIAFVFPGQGSQYTGMLGDLCMAFPCVRMVMERFDGHLHDLFPRGLSRFIYPPAMFSAEDTKADEKALMQTNVAQAAMGAADTAMNELLLHLGASPDMVAGHSYGEYPALFAAGVLSEKELARISEARGRFILASATPEPGTMAAVKAPKKDVAPLLETIDGVWIANLNAPVQTVISGTESGVQSAMKKLGQKGIASKQIPVSCAFHSPIVDGARATLGELLADCPFASPRLPVYSNTTADGFPGEPEAIKALLVKQLVKPVRFVEEIETMYAQGVRTFVEVGAGSVLTNLIKTILRGKHHQTVATDKKHTAGLTQLQHALAVLISAGQRLHLDRLYKGRQCRQLDSRMTDFLDSRPQSSASFIIGGGTVRPADHPAPEAFTPRVMRLVEATAFGSTGPQGETATGTGRYDNNNNSDQVDGDTMGTSFNQQQPSIHMENTAGATPVNDGVISRFQDLMSQFLDTQKAVMTAYLNGTAAAPNREWQASDTMPDIQAAAIKGAQAYSPVTEVQGEASQESPVKDAYQDAAPPPPPSERAEPADKSPQTVIDLKPLLLNIVSDCTGYPVDMLEMEQEIEADLGIDSIKRMQAMEELEAALEKEGFKLPEDHRELMLESLTLADLLAGLESMATGGRQKAAGASPTPESANTESSTGAGVSASLGVPVDVAGMLMSVVSDLSGYPVDMLAPDQEIDADLGIDSIKRMQILEHLENALEADVRLSDGDREKLAESVTLGDIIDALTAMIGTTQTSGRQDPVVKNSTRGKAPLTASGNEEDLAKGDVTGETRKRVVARLYRIVETHTGYPAEILETDLALESDLRMDAAKVQAISDDFIREFEHSMEGFRDIAEINRPASPSVLGDLVDWLVDALASANGGLETAMRFFDHETTGDLDDSSDDQPADTTAIQRFTLVAKQRPLIPSAVEVLQDATILVTKVADDPLADVVISNLKASERKVVVLGHDPAAVQPGANTTNDAETAVYATDFTDVGKLAGIVENINKHHGPVSGLLHLTPLAKSRSFADMDMGMWQTEAAVRVKSLFHIIKVLYDGLAAAVEKGDGSVVAATVMGGTFASVPENGDSDTKAPSFSPLSGGVCGFLKVFAEEMPGLNIRVVDNDTSDAPETIASQITSELLTLSTDIEVGYRQGIRVALDIQGAALATDGSPVMEMDAGSCLLITGGARGITASIALELARRFRPTMLLVGRTPFVETEAVDTAGIEDEKQLKAILAEMLKAERGKIQPIDLENAYHRLMGQREIRETIRQLQVAGASVRYIQGDVTDAGGFSRLIASVYDEYGRIDGVIHGAGRIEDKMIKDKDAASFDRVFDTKADSLFVLCQALQADSLKFMALFSSVAGRFGNAGQADYGAANEVYNKTALYLNRLWPGRVVSYIWGPWESQGMVSDGLREKFNRSGITLIPRKVGTDCFMNELLFGPQTSTEVIFGGWDDRKKALTEARRSAALPLLSFNATIYPSRDGNVVLVRRVDAGIDRYLEDHKLDGLPVMPMAMALELMAEALAYRYPDYYLSAFSDVHVLKGIVLNNGAADILLIVDPVEKTANRVTLAIQIRDSRDKNRVFYRAKADLIREKPVGNAHRAIALCDAAPFSLSVSEAYDTRLFHGPLWQGIQHIESIGKDGIVGSLKRSRPEAYFQQASTSGANEWLIDPLVIDSGLQLVVLWMREQLNATPLPSRLNRFDIFDSPQNGDSLRCEVRVHVPEGGIKSADLFFIKPDGKLAGLMEGLDIIGSESLNRLAAK